MRPDSVLARADGRLAERALALTALALILLTPPIMTIFDARIVIAGIPLLHIYCYGVWLLAIAAGAVLATRLNAEQHDGGSEPGPADRD